MIDTGTATIMVQVNMDDINKFKEEIVQELIEQLSLRDSAHRDDDLLTTEDVIKLLGVCRDTLRQWKTKKYLVPQKIGNRNYYTRRSIKDVMRS